jgi:hypothetical protein
LAVEVAAGAVAEPHSKNAVEIKEVVREDKNFLLQVEVVPVVGVSLQALEELVETTELLELLIQMVVLVEQSLVKDQVLVFPVQVVLAVRLNHRAGMEIPMIRKQDLVELEDLVGMLLL